VSTTRRAGERSPEPGGTHTDGRAATQDAEDGVGVGVGVVDDVGHKG
jgi:hypothetical protein